MWTDFTFAYSYFYDEEDREIFKSIDDYFGSRNLVDENPKNDHAIKKVNSMCIEHGQIVAPQEPFFSNRLVSLFLKIFKYAKNK